MVKLNKQQAIDNLHKSFIKTNLPTIRIGDNVKIGVKIIEGIKNVFNFMKELFLQKRIVQLIPQLQ